MHINRKWKHDGDCYELYYRSGEAWKWAADISYRGNDKDTGMRKYRLSRSTLITVPVCRGRMHIRSKENTEIEHSTFYSPNIKEAKASVEDMIDKMLSDSLEALQKFHEAFNAETED